MFPRSAPAYRSGFTLIELLVVLAIISGVLAVVFPQLLPVIAFSKHEAAARHLASYGRNAMAQASLMNEHFTVYIDLDAQEYWTMRWPNPAELAEREEAKKAGRDGEENQETATSSYDLIGAMMAQEEGEEPDMDLENETYTLLDRFDEFHRQKILALSKNVHHDRDFLEDVGPEFSKDSPFGYDESDLEPEEVDDPLLDRTFFPEDIWIESITVGDDETSSGTVEIDINTSGMLQTVVFYVVNDDDEYYTVSWDAITGGAHLVSGKEDVQ